MEKSQAPDQVIAGHIAQLRAQQSLTLDDLAARSGVSRAMISKIERGEASPTAALLTRLANGLGVSLSSLFITEKSEAPLMRAADAVLWQDPQTLYQRRNVAPRGQSGTDIVDVLLPAGKSVTCDNYAAPKVEQFVWILEGMLRLTIGTVSHDLTAGDCLRMTLDEPIIFANPSPNTTRYAVVLVPQRTFR